MREMVSYSHDFTLKEGFAKPGILFNNKA